MPPNLQSFLTACADIVDLVHLGQTWGVCTPGALQQAAEICLASWVEANLQDHMIKKFHWTLHLGPALARFKKLPACFAMERKHRFICRFASNICNTAVYEHTLLQECLAEELFHLKQPGVFANGIPLIDAHPPKKQFHSLMEQSFGHVIPIDSLQVASRCQLQKSLCTKQDIVLATPFQAMEALAFVSYKGNVFAFVQLLELAEDAKNIGACFWIQSEKRYLVPAETILCPLIYNKDQDKIKTLIPWQVRHLLKQ